MQQEQMVFDLCIDFFFLHFFNVPVLEHQMKQIVYLLIRLNYKIWQLSYFFF